MDSGTSLLWTVEPLYCGQWNLSIVDSGTSLLCTAEPLYCGTRVLLNVNLRPGEGIVHCNYVNIKLIRLPPFPGLEPGYEANENFIGPTRDDGGALS